MPQSPAKSRASRRPAAKPLHRRPPITRERVARNTAEEVNRRIAERTQESVEWHAAHPDKIERRLRELEAEWDMERLLETNASALSFLGVVFALTSSRRWLFLPALVTGFLFQHAVQGWCPPVPLFRRLGIRTAQEIAQERYALKALRGDFDGIQRQRAGASKDADTRADAAMKAVYH